MSEKLQARDEFLHQLRRYLKRLPAGEAEEAILYYEEYLEDAGEENLEEALASLGSPKEIAFSILEEKVFQDLEDSPPSAKKGASAVWVVILAVFASPIALPFAVVLGALALTVVLVIGTLLFSLVLVLLCLLIAVGAVCIACLLGGIGYICFSIPLFFQHVATGFFLLGVGIALTGVGALSGVGTFYFARFTWRLVRELFGRRLPRMFRALFARRKTA